MAESRWFDARERRAGIACPRCGISPAVGEMWMCAPDGCGFMFDTFETRARCPQCEAQFSVTWCPSCGQASPHEAWYRASA